MKERDKSKDQEIIKEALQRYDDCIANNSDIRNEMIDDLRFYSGEQWPEDLKKKRTNKKRPVLTVNRIPTYINQVVNNARQQTPSAKVRPFEDADKDLAEIYQGLIRHIQNNNNSKSAFDTAFFYAVAGSIGWFRILSKYCHDDRFEQELIVDRIDNPASVVAPIHLCKEIDLSDMPYCFVLQKMPRAEYEKTYPNAQLSDFAQNSIGKNWVTDDSVIIAEYFIIEEKFDKKIYLLEDGIQVDELPEGVTAVKERDVYTKKVIWRKLSAVEILEETTFPGKFIPLIPVLGLELNIDGEKKLISLTRNAKDPQREINYYKSAKAERIALAPKTPWVAAAGQIDKYKAIWKESNSENIAVLPYDPVDKNGTLLPPPNRTGSIQTDPGLIDAEREAVDDLKAVTGIFDASIGAQGNETSGKAIVARKMQGDTANFHFVDNYAASIRHCTRILVDAIPEIYDTPRTIRILGDDYKEKVIKVNQEYFDKNKNEYVNYKMDAGRYDVVVDVGPSFQTKRQEAAENLIEVMRNVPIVGEVTADILARNLDFPGADELADRLRALIDQKYPNIIKSDSGEDADKQQIQMLMVQMQQMMQKSQMSDAVIQELNAVIEKMSVELESKEADRQADIAKTVMNNETKKEITQMQIDANQVEKLASAIDMIVSKLDILDKRTQSPVSATNTEQNFVGE